jgi:hypothetical protein
VPLPVARAEVFAFFFLVKGGFAICAVVVQGRQELTKTADM